jgi:hypothetical protein
MQQLALHSNKASPGVSRLSRRPPVLSGAACADLVGTACGASRVHAIEASFRGRGEASFPAFPGRPSPESLPRSVAGTPITGGSRRPFPPALESFPVAPTRPVPGRPFITPWGLTPPVVVRVASCSSLETTMLNPNRPVRSPRAVRPAPVGPALPPCSAASRYRPAAIPDRAALDSLLDGRGCPRRMERGRHRLPALAPAAGGQPSGRPRDAAGREVRHPALGVQPSARRTACRSRS